MTDKTREILFYTGLIIAYLGAALINHLTI